MTMATVSDVVVSTFVARSSASAKAAVATHTAAAMGAVALATFDLELCIDRRLC